MPLEPGARLGPFHVEALLGEGRFAFVYRAIHESGGAVLALKVPKDPAVAPREDMARLEREAQVLASIDEPGIVRLLGTGEAEGVPWVAVELIADARPLEEAFRALRTVERVRLVRDAARALGAVHAKGLVHGDVTPRSLLVDPEGRVHVSDTGIAWGRAGARSARASRTGEERAPPATPAHDVRGLGVLLFLALTDRHPFEGAASLESARSPAPSPLALRPTTPPALDAACRRALSPDPRARHADAMALSRELDLALEAGPVSRRLGPGRAPALAAGMRVGTYRILGPLAKGAMGEVFRARDDSLGRDVALKVVRADRISPQLEGRFRREIEAASKVRHAHLVKVHATGSVAGLRYLVTELVLGDSLATHLARTGAFDVARAAALGRKLALALDALHLAGVLHRDLKPANVILDEEGEPRIVDFGIAKLLEGAWTLTSSRHVVGTPLYASPEQLTGKATDARTDVYSVGAMLHELVAGEPPFTATTFVGLLGVKSRQKAEPASRARADGDDRLDAVIARCLAPRPDDRFPTAVALANALERALESEARPRRRPRVIPVVLAALAVLGVAALVAALGPSAPTRASTPGPSASTPVAIPGAARSPSPGPTPPRASLDPSPAHGLAPETFSATGRTTLVAVLPAVTASSPRLVAVGSDRRRVLVASADGSVRLRDLGSGHELWAASEPGDVPSVIALSPDGKLALEASGNRIRVRSTESGSRVASFDGHAARVVGAEFLPGGRDVVSLSNDGNLRRWDARTEKEDLSLEGPSAATALAISVGARQAFVGLADGGIRVCDLSLGMVGEAFGGARGPIHQIVASDPRSFVALGGDHTLAFWDRTTSARRGSSRLPRAGVVAISPDASVAAVGAERAIRLVHAETGDSFDRIELSAAGEDVATLAYSPDGIVLVAGLVHGTVVVLGVR